MSNTDLPILVDLLLERIPGAADVREVIPPLVAELEQRRVALHGPQAHPQLSSHYTAAIAAAAAAAAVGVRVGPVGVGLVGAGLVGAGPVGVGVVPPPLLPPPPPHAAAPSAVGGGGGFDGWGWQQQQQGQQRYGVPLLEGVALQEHMVPLGGGSTPPTAPTAAVAAGAGGGGGGSGVQIQQQLLQQELRAGASVGVDAGVGAGGVGQQLVLPGVAAAALGKAAAGVGVGVKRLPPWHSAAGAEVVQEEDYQQEQQQGQYKQQQLPQQQHQQGQGKQEQGQYKQQQWPQQQQQQQRAWQGQQQWLQQQQQQEQHKQQQQQQFIELGEGECSFLDQLLPPEKQYDQPRSNDHDVTEGRAGKRVKGSSTLAAAAATAAAAAATGGGAGGGVGLYGNAGGVQGFEGRSGREGEERRLKQWQQQEGFESGGVGWGAGEGSGGVGFGKGPGKAKRRKRSNEEHVVEEEEQGQQKMAFGKEQQQQRRQEQQGFRDQQQQQQQLGEQEDDDDAKVLQGLELSAEGPQPLLLPQQEQQRGEEQQQQEVEAAGRKAGGVKKMFRAIQACNDRRIIAVFQEKILVQSTAAAGVDLAAGDTAAAAAPAPAAGGTNLAAGPIAAAGADSAAAGNTAAQAAAAAADAPTAAGILSSSTNSDLYCLPIREAAAAWPSADIELRCHLANVWGAVWWGANATAPQGFTADQMNAVVEELIAAASASVAAAGGGDGGGGGSSVPAAGCGGDGCGSGMRDSAGCVALGNGSISTPQAEQQQCQQQQQQQQGQHQQQQQQMGDVGTACDLEHGGVVMRLNVLQRLHVELSAVLQRLLGKGELEVLEQGERRWDKGRRGLFEGDKGDGAAAAAGEDGAVVKEELERMGQDVEMQEVSEQEQQKSSSHAAGDGNAGGVAPAAFALRYKLPANAQRQQQQQKQQGQQPLQQQQEEEAALLVIARELHRIANKGNHVSAYDLEEFLQLVRPEVKAVLAVAQPWQPLKDAEAMFKGHTSGFRLQQPFEGWVWRGGVGVGGPKETGGNAAAAAADGGGGGAGESGAQEGEPGAAEEQQQEEEGGSKRGCRAHGKRVRVAKKEREVAERWGSWTRGSVVGVEVGPDARAVGRSLELLLGGRGVVRAGAAAAAGDSGGGGEVMGVDAAAAVERRHVVRGGAAGEGAAVGGEATAAAADVAGTGFASQQQRQDQEGDDRGEQKLGGAVRVILPAWSPTALGVDLFMPNPLAQWYRGMQPQRVPITSEKEAAGGRRVAAGASNARAAAAGGGGGGGGGGRRLPRLDLTAVGGKGGGGGVGSVECEGNVTAAFDLAVEAGAAAAAATAADVPRVQLVEQQQRWWQQQSAGGAGRGEDDLEDPMVKFTEQQREVALMWLTGHLVKFPPVTWSGPKGKSVPWAGLEGVSTLPPPAAAGGGGAAANGGGGRSSSSNARGSSSSSSSQRNIAGHLVNIYCWLVWVAEQAVPPGVSVLDVLQAVQQLQQQYNSNPLLALLDEGVIINAVHGLASKLQVRIIGEGDRSWIMPGSNPPELDVIRGFIARGSALDGRNRCQHSLKDQAAAEHKMKARVGAEVGVLVGAGVLPECYGGGLVGKGSQWVGMLQLLLPAMRAAATATAAGDASAVQAATAAGGGGGSSSSSSRRSSSSSHLEQIKGLAAVIGTGAATMGVQGCVAEIVQTAAALTSPETAAVVGAALKNGSARAATAAAAGGGGGDGGGSSREGVGASSSSSSSGDVLYRRWLWPSLGGDNGQIQRKCERMKVLVPEPARLDSGQFSLQKAVSLGPGDVAQAQEYSEELLLELVWQLQQQQGHREQREKLQGDQQQGQQQQDDQQQGQQQQGGQQQGDQQQGQQQQGGQQQGQQQQGGQQQGQQQQGDQQQGQQQQGDQQQGQQQKLEQQHQQDDQSQQQQQLREKQQQQRRGVYAADVYRVARGMAPVISCVLPWDDFTAFTADLEFAMKSYPGAMQVEKRATLNLNPSTIGSSSTGGSSAGRGRGVSSSAECATAAATVDTAAAAEGSLGGKGIGTEKSSDGGGSQTGLFDVDCAPRFRCLGVPNLAVVAHSLHELARQTAANIRAPKPPLEVSGDVCRPRRLFGKEDGEVFQRQSRDWPWGAGSSVGGRGRQVWGQEVGVAREEGGRQRGGMEERGVADGCGEGKRGVGEGEWAGEQKGMKRKAGVEVEEEGEEELQGLLEEAYDLQEQFHWEQMQKEEEEAAKLEQQQLQQRRGGTGRVAGGAPISKRRRGLGLGGEEVLCEVPGAMPLYQHMLPRMQCGKPLPLPAAGGRGNSRASTTAAAAATAAAAGGGGDGRRAVGGGGGFSQLHREIVLFARHCLSTEQQRLVVRKAMELLQRVARSCWSDGDAIMFGSQVRRVYPWSPCFLGIGVLRDGSGSVLMC